jgi:hypothetical protein
MNGVYFGYSGCRKKKRQPLSPLLMAGSGWRKTVRQYTFAILNRESRCLRFRLYRATRRHNLRQNRLAKDPGCR